MHIGREAIKKNPGGKVLVNPSGPVAEIGHKGAGYGSDENVCYAKAKG
ncbi:MAG: hypothetical protein WCS27_16325 [Victivallaceae bacterium]